MTRRLPVAVVFSKTLEARLRLHCQELGITPSEFVRAAVVAKLDADEKKSYGQKAV